MSHNTDQLLVGVPGEWADFQKRQASFFERFPHLREALHLAFVRTGSSSEPIDKFVFLYGRLCSEDFFEVLLCSGNGYGTAGLKLARSLYERAVTLAYLHKNPDELSDFLDFHHVALHKLVTKIGETFEKSGLSKEAARQVDERYQQVREKFMVTDCAKCGTRRLNHTWNRLDFVAMASKTPLAALIVPGYYLPIRHAHATLGSLLSRLETTETGVLTFIPTAQRREADQALIVAHNIILHVLDIQEERFKVPGLSEKLGACKEDFQDIWS